MNTEANNPPAGDGAARGKRAWAALLERQGALLDKIAGGATRQDVLEALVTLVEDLAPGMRCAVLLADESRQRLRFAAAPGVTDDFTLGIEPFLAIAPNGCSCGAAAALGKPVYTRDTASDLLWAGCAHVAMRNGIRAAWSTPIVSDAGAVLGTLALYHREPRLPSDDQRRIMGLAAKMARLALEICSRSEGSDLCNDAGGAILVTDLVGDVVCSSERLATLLGYAPRELQGHNISMLAPLEAHDELVRRILAAGHAGLTTDRVYRARDGRAISLREHWSLRWGPGARARYCHSRVEEAPGDQQGGTP